MTTAKATKAPKAAGRPSTYTPELGDLICEQLAEGKSLREICAVEGMPDRKTVDRWTLRDVDFAAKRAHAREAQADLLNDRMAEIESDTLIRKIDPQAARAVLSSMQWRAAKLHPKRYGDKVQIGGAEDLPPVGQVHALSVEALTAIAAQAAKK